LNAFEVHQRIIQSLVFALDNYALIVAEMALIWTGRNPIHLIRDALCVLLCRIWIETEELLQHRDKRLTAQEGVIPVSQVKFT